MQRPAKLVSNPICVETDPVNALIPICRLVKLLKLYNESGKVPVIEFGDQIFSGIVPFIELLFNRSDSNDPISPGMLPAKLFYTDSNDKFKYLSNKKNH